MAHTCHDCDRQLKVCKDAEYAAEVAQHAADRAIDAYRVHIHTHYGGDDAR